MPFGPTDRNKGAAGPVLLYDGRCGFCDAAVRLVLRHDAQGLMRFAPLEGATAQAVLARHPALQDVDSLVLVEGSGADEEVFIRSEAALRIGRYLGGVWALSSILRWVPRPLRDGAYAFFARHRHRMFRRYDACPAPPPEVRARFLP